MDYSNGSLSGTVVPLVLVGFVSGLFTAQSTKMRGLLLT